jgi:RNA polymerase sigma-70 factor (ECF subfamily)
MQDDQDIRVTEGLFKSQYKLLRAYAYRFLNDMKTAEDVVQDAFCELWVKRADIRFNNSNSVKAYLFKTIYNRSINILNDKRKDTCSLEESHESQIAEAYRDAFYMQDQEKTLLLKELEHEIILIIQTLPPQCRKIYTLSRTYELKNREIAEQLGISIKAVEKQLGKAIHELKSHLRDRGLLDT